MRKRILTAMLLAVATCFAVSCQKDEDVIDALDNMRLSKFTGSINQPGADAKTTLDGNSVQWVSGDKVAINGKTYTAIPNSDPTTTKFGLPEGESDVDLVDGYYTAYYPASLLVGDQPTLPAVQNYEAGRISNLPMYAKSDNTTLAFHNICGVMELTLKGSKKVSGIVVSSESAALNGAFSVNSDNVAVINDAPSYANKTVTLNCESDVQLNGTGVKFWIALPAGSHKLTLSVYAEDGTYCDKMTTGNVTIAANKIYSFDWQPEFSMRRELSGPFAGNNRTIRFAMGNVIGELGARDYAFHAHQYDRYLNGGENFEYERGEECDMFSRVSVDENLDGSCNGRILDYFNDGGGQWLLPSEEDMTNIIGTTRSGSTVNGLVNCRFAKVSINTGSETVPGIMLCPDDATIIGAEISGWNETAVGYTNATTLSKVQWSVYERSGCVFLPYRLYSYVPGYPTSGTDINYWLTGEVIQWTNYPAFGYEGTGYRPRGITLSSGGDTECFYVRLIQVDNN